MKIYKSITIDMKSGAIIAEQSYEYKGPVALCDGGGGGGGGGGDNNAADMFDSLGVIEGSGMGKGWGREGRQEASGEKTGKSFMKNFIKGFGAATTITMNPALGVIAGIAYGLSESGLPSGSEAPEASAIGNIEGAHPEMPQGSRAGIGLSPEAEEKEEKAAEGAEPGTEPNIEERKRAEERRQRARKRMGYWSTRRTTAEDLGPLNIFTPELY